MNTIDLSQVITDAALSCNLDPSLALAIAYVESGVDTTKTRYEAGWRYLVSPKKYAKSLGISEDTETQLQMFSWGCMQIMGSNARALGYSGQLPLLIAPRLGVLYACKQLQMIQNKYKTESDLISSYNQGSPAKLNGLYKNQSYVDQVTDRLNFLRKDPINGKTS